MNLESIVQSSFAFPCWDESCWAAFTETCLSSLVQCSKPSQAVQCFFQTDSEKWFQLLLTLRRWRVDRNEEQLLTISDIFHRDPTCTALKDSQTSPITHPIPILTHSCGRCEQSFARQVQNPPGKRRFWARLQLKRSFQEATINNFDLRDAAFPTWILGHLLTMVCYDSKLFNDMTVPSMPADIGYGAWDFYSRRNIPIISLANEHRATVDVLAC
jgi:hypothetical protein